jgi:hypothetical protein
MNMLRIIVSALLILTLCAEYRAEVVQTAPSVTIESILWWFPENTETLIVAKGPYVINDSEPNDLKHSLEQASYGPLSAIQQGKFLKPIIGKTVLLSVEGSRNFRPPANLGSMMYEGCHVLVFGHDFGTARDSFIEQIKTHAKEVQKFAGHEVMMFEQKLESDIWKIYIASPQSDVILCATDRGFLTETLNRINSKAKQRALPESLPEWKQVDTTARFWAVRHYDKENALRDTTSPLHGKQAAANALDDQAIGITLTYNPNGDDVRVKYLSGNSQAATTAYLYWNPSPYKLNVKIINSEPRVVEIVIKLDNPDVFLIFLLCLFSAFGHALYI